MWTSPRRLAFAFRSFTAELGARLGSWRLSIVLMVAAALYYAFLAIWATSSPPRVVRSIASLAPFWLLYLLLLVNTGFCMWRRLPALGEEWRARPGAIGSYLFHAAFFVLAAGLSWTLLTRQEARVWVAEGEEFAGRQDQFLDRSPPRPLAGELPVPPFRVEGITAGFWRDELLFTGLEAELTMEDGRRASTRINRPLWLGWGTFLRLSGFGYTPRYELLDRHGRSLAGSFVKLDVFPPGRRDYFSPPGYPHRIYVEVFPDFAVEDGDPVTRSLGLVAPAVGVRVYRGRFELGTALLRPGDGFEFEGLRLRFPEIRTWGELSLVRDPGAPLVFLSYLLGLAGLACWLAAGRGAPR